jgi:hypothetical protein
MDPQSLTNTLISPQGEPIAEVEVVLNYEGGRFIQVNVKALQAGNDNCLTRTMNWRQTPPRELPLKEWSQVVTRNPATLALAHLLLDSEELNRAAGHCVFVDYVAKIIAAIDALWD